MCLRDPACPTDRSRGGQHLGDVLRRNLVPLDHFPFRAHQTGLVPPRVDRPNGSCAADAGSILIPPGQNVGDQRVCRRRRNLPYTGLIAVAPLGPPRALVNPQRWFPEDRAHRNTPRSQFHGGSLAGSGASDYSNTSIRHEGTSGSLEIEYEQTSHENCDHVKGDHHAPPFPSNPDLGQAHQKAMICPSVTRSSLCHPP
jgi:hypothetical protein